MSADEIHHRINTEPDFINSKRYDNSLEKLLERYPEGAPAKIVAQVLLMSETEVEDMYQQVILRLREAMKVDV